MGKTDFLDRRQPHAFSNQTEQQVAQSDLDTIAAVRRYMRLDRIARARRLRDFQQTGRIAPRRVFPMRKAK